MKKNYLEKLFVITIVITATIYNCGITAQIPDIVLPEKEFIVYNVEVVNVDATNPNNTIINYRTIPISRTLPSVTGYGGYKKTSGEIVGPSNFTGVPFSILLQEFSWIPENYIIRSRSGDGWINEYTKDVVEGLVSGYTPSGSPLDQINSTMVLAYEEDGSPISDGGPLKIVFLNEDGNLTDGFRWSKDVVRITIVEVVPITLILSNYILSQSNNSSINAVYSTDKKLGLMK